MRKSLLSIILCLFTCIVYSQKIQNSIWGCEFGSKKSDVISVIKKQGLKYVDKGMKIEIESPEFAGITFDYAVFSFYLDRMYICFFAHYIHDKSSAVSVYSYIKKNLINKYGTVKESIDNKTKTIFYCDNINGIKLDLIEKESRAKVPNGIFNFSYFVGLSYVNYPILEEVTNGI